MEVTWTEQATPSLQQNANYLGIYLSLFVHGWHLDSPYHKDGVCVFLYSSINLLQLSLVISQNWLFSFLISYSPPFTSVSVNCRKTSISMGEEIIINLQGDLFIRCKLAVLLNFGFQSTLLRWHLKYSEYWLPYMIADSLRCILWVIEIFFPIFQRYTICVNLNGYTLCAYQQSQEYLGVLCGTLSRTEERILAIMNSFPCPFIYFT